MNDIFHFIFDVQIADAGDISILNTGWKLSMKYIRTNILKVLKNVNFFKPFYGTSVKIVAPEEVGPDDLPEYDFEDQNLKLSMTLKRYFYRDREERELYRDSIFNMATSIQYFVMRMIVENYIKRGFHNTVKAFKNSDNFLLKHNRNEFGKLNDNFDFDLSAFVNQTGCAMKPLILVANTHGYEVSNVVQNDILSSGGVNLLKSTVQRGQYFRLAAFDLVPKSTGLTSKMLCNVHQHDGKNFKLQSSRDIRVYDFHKHEYCTISFLDCVKNCFRFDEDGGLSEVHTSKEVVDDIFKFNQGEDVAHTWINVCGKYLDELVLSAVVESMMCAFRKVGFEDESQLKKLCSSMLPEASVSSLTNPNLDSIAHFSSILSTWGSVKRVCAIAFLNSRICRQNIISMHKWGAFVPVDFIVFRPWEEFDTNSMLIFNTTPIKSKVRIRDSNKSTVFVEEHHVNYSLNFDIDLNLDDDSKLPILYQDVEYFLRGGANTEFINTHDIAEIRENGGLKRGERSLIACMVPITKTLPNVLEIVNTGSDKRYWCGLDFYTKVLDIPKHCKFSTVDDRVNHFGQNEIIKCNATCTSGFYHMGI